MEIVYGWAGVCVWCVYKYDGKEQEWVHIAKKAHLGNHIHILIEKLK